MDYWNGMRLGTARKETVPDEKEIFSIWECMQECLKSNECLAVNFIDTSGALDYDSYYSDEVTCELLLGGELKYVSDYNYSSRQRWQFDGISRNFLRSNQISMTQYFLHKSTHFKISNGNNETK